jgi:hypothetical protein
MNDPLNAEGRWYEILTTLGVPAHYLHDKHGPCPMCGEDRFRWDDRNRRGDYFCNGCGPGNGITLLSKFNNWTKDQACAEVGRLTGTHKEKPLAGNPDPGLSDVKTTGAISNNTSKPRISSRQASSYIRRVSDDQETNRYEMEVAYVLVTYPLPLSIREIARQSNLPKNTARDAIKRLERRGYAEGSRDIPIYQARAADCLLSPGHRLRACPWPS